MKSAKPGSAHFVSEVNQRSPAHRVEERPKSRAKRRYCS